MDMKVSGMYIARQLSFTGVTFRIEEIPLDQQYKIVYDKAAKLVSRSHRGGDTDASFCFGHGRLLCERV